MNSSMDDVLIPFHNITDEQIQHYIGAIKASDLPKPLQWEIIDVLETAIQQTHVARRVGWL